MVWVIAAVERFGGHPAFLLEGVADRQCTGAGFRGVCEIGRLISEVFCVSEDLSDVVKPRNHIYAGRGTLVDGGFVTECLVGVVGAALGFCVKEIHVSKLGNRHVSAHFFQQDASDYSFRVTH